MLDVAGALDLSRPGPHPFPDIADWTWTQHFPFKAAYTSNHRSVYLMTQRLHRHPFLGLFDGPDTNTTTDVPLVLDRAAAGAVSDEQPIHARHRRRPSPAERAATRPTPAPESAAWRSWPTAVLRLPEETARAEEYLAQFRTLACPPA